MKPMDHNWQRLMASARRWQEDRQVAAPSGFATRVVARAFARERATGTVLERFALRALGVSCLLAVLGIVTNYSLLSQANATTSIDAYFTTDDPASIVLDVAP